MNSEQLEQTAAKVLDYARRKGATAAEVGVSHTHGLSVNVRHGQVDTLEHNNDKGLGVTVYFGQAKASASTSDFSDEALASIVEAACGIAQHTQEDPCAGLADAALMASVFPDLSLYHPWDISAEQAIELAAECEQSGLDTDSQISNSEGATLSTHQGCRIYANSHGFMGVTHSSQHSLGCTLIAEDKKGMQRDYWYDVKRDVADLASAKEIGRRAARNTVQRCNAQPAKTGRYSVIFSAETARSLFAHLVSAIRGSALYRQSSFLLDQLGQPIFPDWMRIYEQPFLLKGLGSAAFDAEGVATHERDVVTDGRLQGYVLDSYSARRLKMQTTANAGGVHNLTVDTQSLDQDALLREMGTGILVTDTMGMGVNIVTGDYSQGATGFWVENGIIQYPIDEFTIAGHLRDMFRGIQAISSDVDHRGNILTGSVWLDALMIAA